MRRRGFRFTVVLVVAGAAVAALARAEEPAPPEESFYARSLHFTNRGIEFLYAKEQGGLERITGMTADELGCMKAKCHVRTCDVCHKKETDGKASFSVEAARSEAACQRCHPVEKDDPDVHFKAGMKCMGCHSAREIHGDGVAYDTYMQPGALDTRCEKCHESRAKTVSHTIHKGKVDCPACHTRDFTNCLNCHIDTRLATGKDVEIPLKGMLFLVNHENQVTTANFLTYVSGNKTMITFAPYFSHSIQKQGRACSDCHDSEIVRAVTAGTLVPVRWENGEAKNLQGVIPAVEGMKWKVPFLRHEQGVWTPLESPAEPLVNYSGFCTPLSREQLARLEKRRGKAE
jgi:hypothetical protein